MTTPQPGIFALGTRAHNFLEFDLRPGVDPVALLTELASMEQPRLPVGGVNFVVGFAPELWRGLAPEDTPATAAPFQTIEGLDGVTFPATHHDAWVWVATATRDAAFDAARAIVAALRDVAELGDDADGFVYHDSRDLSGFIDGTANRPLDRAAEVVAVGAGEPGAGASVVLVQRWVHDLDALHALPVPDQEAVIGQTKADGIELDEDVMPVDAHVARVEIDDADGSELEIFRRSVPIGDVRAHGLEFVAFCHDQTVIDTMLRRMAGLDDGIRDRLTDFTTAVTGAYYVVPSVEALRRFARPT